MIKEFVNKLGHSINADRLARVYSDAKDKEWVRNTKYYQEYNKAVELTANLAHKFFTYISSGEAVASLADDGLKKEMSEIQEEMIKDATTDKDITELFWFLLNLPVLSKVITKKNKRANILVGTCQLYPIYPAIADICTGVLNELDICLREQDMDGVDSDQRRIIHKFIVKAVLWLDKELDTKVRPNMDPYSLLSEFPSECYESKRVLLAVVAFLHDRLAGVLEREIENYENQLEKSKKQGKQPPKTKILKWLKSFPTEADVFAQSYAVIRQAFYNNSKYELDYENLTFGSIWKKLRFISRTIKDNVYGTLKIQRNIFDEFKSVAGKIKSFSLSEESEAYFEQEIYSDIAERTYNETQSIVEDQYLPMTVQRNSKDSEENAAEKPKGKEENEFIEFARKSSKRDFAEIMREYGLTRLKFDSSSRNYLNYDVVCVFSGFLYKLMNERTLQEELGVMGFEAELIIHALTESLLTGASVANILLSRDKRVYQSHSPIGLFISANRWFKKRIESDLTGEGILENTWKKFLKILKYYNAKYPMYKIETPNGLSYSGKAYRISIAGQSPHQVMNSSGSIIPGLNNCMYYLDPAVMPYREYEINEMYVKNILSFIKKGGLEGADDEINNYIGLAKYIWIDVKKTLTDKDAIRQKLLKRGRPLIITINDKEMNEIFQHIKEKLEDKNLPGEEHIIYVQVLMLYFLYALLLLRPGEPDKLTWKHISLTYNLAFIEGKDNKDYYAESRILPFICGLAEMLRLYKDRISELYPKNKNLRKIFPDINKAKKAFRDILRKVNPDLEIYAFRKTGANAIHNMLYPEKACINLINIDGLKPEIIYGIQGIAMELFSAILGHNYTGFELLTGLYSDAKYSQVRRILEKHAGTVMYASQLEDAIDILKEAKNV